MSQAALFVVLMYSPPPIESSFSNPSVWHPHSNTRRKHRPLGAFALPLSPLALHARNTESRQKVDCLDVIRQSTDVRTVHDACFADDCLEDSSRVAAAALKRITQILSQDPQQYQALNLNRQLLPVLLKRIGGLKQSPKIAADVLISLSILQRRHGLDTRQTAQHVWRILQKQADVKDFCKRQNPRLLLQCMRAAIAFGFSDDSAGVYTAISQRLVQGDALAKLSSIDVVRCLISLSTKQELFAGADSLVFAYARRLRKQNVQLSLKPAQRLWALDVLGKFSSMGSKVDTECRTASYSLLKQFFLQSEEPLCGSQAVLLMRTAFEFLKLETSDPLAETLYQHLEDDSEAILRSLSLNQLGHFCRISLHASMRLRTTQWARRISRRFSETVSSGALLSTNGKETSVSPQSVSHILRYAVLAKHPADTYRLPVRGLFLTREFLEICDESHLSNFVWFLHRTHWLADSEVNIALGTRVLELDSVSAQHASRLLAGFTGIILASNEEIEEDQEQLLAQLFHFLGEPLLLANNLSAIDVSSAIYAYAKASYIQDMGIFDHLVDMLVGLLSVDTKVTVRQVAQTLWACGKMASFENDPGAVEAPYHRAAIELVAHLSSSVDEMTTKDVAQSLWAVGRLEMEEENVLPLIHKAQDLAPELNHQEVANCLWAMSRIRSKESKAVFHLTRRFTKEMQDGPSPQEAANIVYALGRLDIRDEEVFSNLSHVIMDQIEGATAQAVANVLWAYDNVYISPPRQLLDRWANEKLGLVSVQSKDPYENFTNYS